MQSEPILVSEEQLNAASHDVVDRVWQSAISVSHGDLSGILKMTEKYIGPAVFGIFAIFVAYFIAKFASRVCSVPICKRVDETLGKFVSKLVFYAIMVATTIGVVGKLGFNVTSFAAVLTAAGFAVGLAFQGTLSNFAAGVLLLVFRPFKVGDSVVVAGINGKVYEIDLFSTAIDTSDNRRIILPNSSIAGNMIENTTHHAHRRVEVSVGIAYENDLLASRTALTEAVESLGDLIISGENRGYNVSLSKLAPHSVEWAIQAWVKTTDVGFAKEVLTVSVKESLDAAGLRIPYPQLDVHWHGRPSDHIQPHDILSLTDRPPAEPSTFSARRRVA